MIEKLTLSQIEQRMDWVENMIRTTKDTKALPALNTIYQKLLDELVRRDWAE